MTVSPSRIGRSLAGVAALWTLAAFFLPWVQVALRDPAVAQVLSSQSAVGAALGQIMGQAGHVTIAIEQPEGLVATDLAALATLPSQLTGAQIPGFLREDRVRVLLAVAQFWQGRQPAWAQRGWLVYAVPGLALLGALLLMLGARGALAGAVAAAFAVLAVAAAAWWGMHDWQTPAVLVRLGVGLWSSWWAYWVMAWGALLCVRQQRIPTA